jgi:hypothetical protein
VLAGHGFSGFHGWAPKVEAAAPAREGVGRRDGSETQTPAPARRA